MTLKIDLSIIVKDVAHSSYKGPSGFENLEIPFEDGDIDNITPAVASIVAALVKVAHAKYQEALFASKKSAEES